MATGWQFSAHISGGEGKPVLTEKQARGHPHGHFASFHEAETRTHVPGSAFDYKHPDAWSDVFYFEVSSF